MSKAKLFAAITITIVFAFVPIFFPQHLFAFLGNRLVIQSVGIITIISVPALAVVIATVLK
jgi:hypothetical protein